MLLQIPSLDRCDIQKVIVLQLVKLATKSNSKHNWLLLGSEGNLFLGDTLFRGNCEF